MAEKKFYRLKTGVHASIENNKTTRYEAGVRGSDIMELTDEGAQRFEEGRLEPISGEQARKEMKEGQSPTTTATVAGADNTATTETNDFSEILSGSITDIEDDLDKMTDPEQVRALGRAEKEGRNRVGVAQLVEKRLAELEEE